VGASGELLAAGRSGDAARHAAGIRLERGAGGGAAGGKNRGGENRNGEAAMDSSPEIAPASTGPAAGALDLLMDVQLAVSMRFGSRRLLLREVLDLSPGAVVELDRGCRNRSIFCSMAD